MRKYAVKTEGVMCNARPRPHQSNGLKSPVIHTGPLFQSIHIDALEGGKEQKNTPAKWLIRIALDACASVLHPLGLLSLLY